MKLTGLLSILLLASMAGCGPKSPLQAASSRGESPRAISPLMGYKVAPPQMPAATPRPPKPVPVPLPVGLTADDLSYLRWLIQFDAATQQIITQQAHALPPAVQKQDLTRVRAMLQGWEDAKHEVGVLNTKASMATEYTLRLQQIQSQFQQRQPPPDCRAIAAGYSRFLGSLADTSQFNMGVYRQLALLMRNPRGASQMIPMELQDGGAAVDSRLRGEMQGAKESVNTALSALFQRFPVQIPVDIAAFRVR